MTDERRELLDSLDFQISLLRLAVVPHSTPRYTLPGAVAEQELAKLSERVPVPSRQSTKTRLT